MVSTSPAGDDSRWSTLGSSSGDPARRGDWRDRPTAFIRRRVQDYEKWRQVYDEFTQANRSGVAVEPAVYRSVEDPHDLLVIHRFSTSAEVQPWLDDTGRRQAMMAAGVLGSPQVDIAYEDEIGRASCRERVL